MINEERLADEWYGHPIYTDEPEETECERCEDGDSQCANILRHMMLHRSITAKTALERYGCFRLSARIYDLRQRGFNIETQAETRRINGHTVRYARYWLRSM